MKICHVGAAASIERLDGVNNTIWLISKAQANLGHQVFIMLDEEPDKVTISWSKKYNINLIKIPANRWSYELSGLKEIIFNHKIDIFHMHSVFIPKQASLAGFLRNLKMPFVVTPHGGIDFHRSKLRKILYIWALEKSRIMTSSAVTVVTPREANLIKTIVPKYTGIVKWIPNPVDFQMLPEKVWEDNESNKNIVFLGRFDVLHKGIDRLIDIAKELPEYNFQLFGNNDPKTEKWLIKIKNSCPKNVFFNPPIFREDKAHKLLNSRLYIQPSRWEGFPVSVAEAMCLGIPCAVSEHLKFADLISEFDLGLLLKPSALESAIQIRNLMSDSKQLKQWSSNSKKFAFDYFQPEKIALQYVSLYQKVIQS